ncbi:MAG: hypothetical protein ABI222_11020 [Opitutaceae bacterium]
MAASPLSGLAAADAPASKGADSPKFDSLLPAKNQRSSQRGKKTCDAARTAGSPKPDDGAKAADNPAASAVWSAWFAALTPVQAPRAKPAGNDTSDGALTGEGGAAKSGGVPDKTTAASGVMPTPGPMVGSDSGELPATGKFVPGVAKVGEATNTPGLLSVPAAGKLPADGVSSVALAVATAAPLTASSQAAAPIVPPTTVPLPAPVATDAAAQMVAGTPVQSGSGVPAPATLTATKGKQAVSDLAKFAALPLKPNSTAVNQKWDEDKKILSVTDKDVTLHESEVGTDNAFVASVPTTVQQTSLPTDAAHGHVSAVSLQPVTTAAQPVNSGDLSLLAHRAVDAVMTATDRLDIGTRSTVRLQFSVGDASLSVHVELRAGEIHATFRTDSSDLRTALASEWQTMSGESGRAVRLANPVFAPATTNEHATGFGDGAAQQRNPGDQASAEKFSTAGFAPASVRAATSAEPAAPDRRPAPRTANLNLYTFA